MSDNLFRILYCSRNMIPGTPATQQAEIASILSSSRAGNRQHLVTGALLFNSGYFAQVLEGPRHAIEHIFEKIQRDERHGDVTVLESGDSPQRDFPEWSMAYVHPSQDGAPSHLASTLSHALLHPVASAQPVLDLLRTLVIQED